MAARGGAVAPGSHLQGRHFDQAEYFFQHYANYIIIVKKRLAVANITKDDITCAAHRQNVTVLLLIFGPKFGCVT